MKSAIEQSIKEKIKALAKERETTFAELWRNLILERFLTRLAKSPYKEKFILKGGTLLSKKGVLKLPESIEEIVSIINQWVDANIL